MLIKAFSIMYNLDSLSNTQSGFRLFLFLFFPIEIAINVAPMSVYHSLQFRRVLITAALQCLSGLVCLLNVLRH